MLLFLDLQKIVIINKLDLFLNESDLDLLIVLNKIDSI